MKSPTVLNQVSSGNMTTWNGITIAATYMRNRKLLQRVLLRTRTHAAMAEKIEITAREIMVMIRLSRTDVRKLKVGLFHTSEMFLKRLAGFSGKPTGELMISALVRMELSRTIAKGSMNRIKRTSVRISSAIRRPGCGMEPAIRSICSGCFFAITPQPPCSCYRTPG